MLFGVWPGNRRALAWLSRLGARLLTLGLLAATTGAVRADSVVVFNEIMYHPATNEPAFEWLELHNQMAVKVDMSGWSLTGGVSFTFPDGTVIAGGGYVVVALSPTDLKSATGLTNVLGPFSGRLANSGETLQLLNNSQRLMDEVTYGADGDWPVGADGGGVSLAKRNEHSGSAAPGNWMVSALVGGTPGKRNFATTPFETTNTTAVLLNGSWRYEASGADLGSAWRQRGFDDAAWASGPGLFQAGTVAPPASDLQAVPTVFNSGVGPDGKVLPPGQPDPHYQLTQSAQSTPPPPAIQATVIQNHPAWLGNDTASSWIGPINPGTENAAAGVYVYRTTFSLDGFDPATASLKMSFAADNRINDALLNGVSVGANYAGFNAWSPDYSATTGFHAGLNTLDFLTANDDTSPNPAGFRARLAASARRQFPVATPLPTGPATYYFRTPFVLAGVPSQTALRLDCILADGAVFYINGVEVLRQNLPAGAVTATTPALSQVTKPVSAGPFLLPTGSLLTGTNVLAVELHKAVGSGPNALFGADLQMSVTNILVPPPVTLAFNELASATNSDFWLELMNYGPSSLDLGGCVLVGQGSATNHEYVFPPQTLASGELVAVSAATLGFAVATGDRLLLYSPSRTSVLDGVVAKTKPRGRWPDGTGAWLRPTTLTPGASNQFSFHRELVINELMYAAPGLPAQPAVFGTNLLISITNDWKYQSLGQDPGTAWRTYDFDDTAWPMASAVFYNTPAVLPAPKNTQLPLNDGGAPIITWYFRAPFDFEGRTNAAQLTLRPIVDDGAVYYLNGVEIFRQNMPAGDIGYGTLATTSVATPAYSGPFTVTVTNLVPGGNLLAVGVHQLTTNPIAADMAFAVEASLVGQLSPAVPAHSSPEEWVEIYNRGTEAVDLTGWQLGQDIAYDFPSQTVIPAGGYLVVARDLGFMSTNYSGLGVLGPFSGSLHHSGHVQLVDPAGNPANDVVYYDAKPWPEYPGGGGSSLELRDPLADNTKAEAWAASDESARTGWTTYTYRAVSANVLGPTLWKEFVMGLLDAGECLIDDLSVIESPDTTPVQMLQNGTFENGLTAWRALGTHAYSRVEVDPDNAANHVLHLITTGWTYHIHDHLETTLANGRAVVDGRTYQISFRAKWVAGNNRLNTRLYFNRVARTTALPMSTQHGTPGARNSTFAGNTGPTYSGLNHSPVVPQPGDAVTVGVAAYDPQGIQSLALRWSANGGAWQTTPMTATGPASEPGYVNYQATVPGQPAGTVVQFFAQGTDALSAVSAYPAGGTNSRALFRVNDGTALMPQLHRLALIMTPADTVLLHALTNVMTYDRRGLTVIEDEREVFYDVGVHLQSSERGRSDPSRVGFSLKFNADHLYRGAQNTVTLDRSGGYSGRGGRQDEIVLWHAANHAGGLYGLSCDLVQVFTPRPTDDSTAMMRMSAYDSQYWDGQFKNGSNGNLYKLELIYYPLTTFSGDPQSPKVPQPDDVINVEIQNSGDSQENYRWPFLEENHADADDYSQLIAFNKAFSLTGTTLETQTGQIMDVDEWMRVLAFKAFTGDADTFTYGLNHNFKIFIRPTDGRALGLLWDMDFAYSQAINYASPGSGSPNTYKIVNLPNNYRRFYHHLFDIMTTSVNSGYLAPWVAHYGGLLGQDWSGIMSYLQQRADYLKGTMPLTTPFVITSNQGKNFATTSPSTALTGTAPMPVANLQVNGLVYPVRWTSLTAWTLTVSLPSYTNTFNVLGLGDNGVPLPGAMASITVTNTAALGLVPVVINEWMAGNSAPGGYPDPADGRYSDWFELYNPNDAAINLGGYGLSDTVTPPAKWTIPANTLIAPKGFLLVWADKQTNLNGSSPGGDLHADFKLSKSGSVIALTGPDGALRHSVTFGPQAGNISQGAFPDGSTNSVISMANWTPRAPNQSGLPPSPQIGPVQFPAGGAVAFSVSALSGRTYQVEYKDALDASAWTPLGAPRTATDSQLTITDTTPAGAARFYRLVLLQ